MEDGEGEGDVEDDTDQARGNSHVETADALLLVDLHEAVLEALVLVGVDALHLGLNDINGVVGHGRAETSEATGQEIDDDLVGDVVSEGLLGVLKHDESHTLVGGLLHQSWDNTLVESTGTVLSGDGVDSVEQVSVLRLWGKLVMNQSSLESFLRSDDEDGLHGSGADTAEEVVSSGLSCEKILLNVGECSKSDVVLGDREHQEGTVTLVKGEEAASLNGVLDDVDCAHLVLLLEELHDSLGVLSGVCA